MAAFEPRFSRWFAVLVLLGVAVALVAVGGSESRRAARRLAEQAAAMDRVHAFLLQCREAVAAFGWAAQVASGQAGGTASWREQQFAEAGARLKTAQTQMQQTADSRDLALLNAAFRQAAAAMAADAAALRGGGSAALLAAAQTAASSAYNDFNQLQYNGIDRLAEAVPQMRAEEARQRDWVTTTDDGAAALVILALFLLALEFRARRHAAALRRSALEDFRIGTYRRTGDGRLLFYNRACAELLGLAPGAPRPVSLTEFAADDAAREYFGSSQPGGNGVEVALQRRDGTRAWARATARVVRGSDIEGVLLDISERRLLQDRLRQAEKLEALGQLSGGVAHDFNNLLTVITGHCELLLLQSSLEPAVRAKLERVQAAATTAANITRQLLVFSRKQPGSVMVLDLNHSLSVGEGLIRAILGEQIEIVVQPAPQAAWVRIDATQLQQILMNLAVNARDAMGNSGRLTFTVQHRRVQPGSGHPVPSGDYVLLTASDNGHGMDEATSRRIFEPFFTTKALGTGLGLSTVHSIVLEANGFIFVNSQPGRGTTFEIYFPAAQPAATGQLGPAVAPEASRP